MGRAFILAAPLLMTVLLGAAAAPATIDADMAVGLARRNNLKLQGERLNLRTAARAQRTAWNELLPSLSGSASLIRSNQVTSVMGNEPSPWNVGFAVQASLPLSAATALSIQNTTLSYQAGQIDYQTADKQLARDVRKSFYRLLLARENIGLAEQELATAEVRYQQARRNYAAGLVPRLQVLSAQVAAENLRPALEKRRVSYETALLQFKQLLGIDLAEEIVLQGSITVESRSFDPGDLATRYLGERLDVRKLEKQMEILKNAKRLRKAIGLSPTLSISFSYAPGLNDPFAADWRDDEVWSDSGKLALNLQVPLDGFLPGSKTQVDIAEAEDNIEKTKLALQQARDLARIEIESILLQLETSLRSIAALELNVALAKETYTLAEQAYQAGTEELLNVQNASDALQKARLNLLNEKYTYLSGLFDLEYALNTPLDELEVSHE